MYTQDLEKILKDSLEDFKLDKSEKYVFKDLSRTLENDQLSFIRNKAFELSRSYVEAGGTDAIKVLNWLDRIVKAIQPVQQSGVTESSAYFSPGDSCRNKIISLMNGSKKSVDICLFTISDNRITGSILDAYKRGIEVTIISDNDKSNDKGSDIARLSDEGVNVILDRSPHHMHHKFAIFDKKILLNGSFNWTRSASDVNQENILVTFERDLVSAFRQKFDGLKDKFSER